MAALNPLFALSGRILIAFMFIMSGVGKITGFEATQAYMEAQGVPGMLLLMAILVELVGGLAIVVGWYTRISAFLLAGFCVVSAVLFHLDFADQIQTIMFMKNMAIAGGFLFLVRFGAGEWSIDGWRGSFSKEAFAR